MKTVRRHELQTNELAQRLSAWYEQIKPYSSTITLVAVGVLVVLAISGFVASQRRAASATAWESYFETGESETLEPQDYADKMRKAAKEHAGTSVEDWALLAA